MAAFDLRLVLERRGHLQHAAQAQQLIGPERVPADTPAQRFSGRDDLFQNFRVETNRPRTWWRP